MRTSYDTDSSSDDDDSDDNAVAVYLGYAGRMCTTKEDHGAAASLNSYQRTKIGGLADYIRTTTTTTTTTTNDNNNSNHNSNDNNSNKKKGDLVSYDCEFDDRKSKYKASILYYIMVYYSVLC